MGLGSWHVALLIAGTTLRLVLRVGGLHCSHHNPLLRASAASLERLPPVHSIHCAINGPRHIPPHKFARDCCTRHRGHSELLEHLIKTGPPPPTLPTLAISLALTPASRPNDGYKARSTSTIAVVDLATVATNDRQPSDGSAITTVAFTGGQGQAASRTDVIQYKRCKLIGFQKPR